MFGSYARQSVDFRRLATAATSRIKQQNASAIPFTSQAVEDGSRGVERSETHRRQVKESVGKRPGRWPSVLVFWPINPALRTGLDNLPGLWP